MGSRSVSLVPRKSSVLDKENIIEKVIIWLVEKDIIKKEKSNCLLDDSKLGYEISQGAKLIVKIPDKLSFKGHINGLEVITDRTIFTPMRYGLDNLMCPSCKIDISKEPWQYFDEWYSTKSDNLTCPNCDNPSDIHEYSFHPNWGFSDLGFTFWNCSEFKEEFILNFEKLLKMKVDVVLAKI